MRHYAACLYAAALFIPLAQQRDPDDPLLQFLTSSLPGRRLALAGSQQERMRLTRMLLDEALVFCRDDDALLDLTASVYDVMGVLDAETDPSPEMRRVLAKVNGALAIANEHLP